MKKYPRLEIDLEKVRENIRTTKKYGDTYGVNLTGVVKMFNGISEVVQAFAEEGITFIASSRIEQLKQCRKNNINSELMLIRGPQEEELEDVVMYCDVSLQTEITVVRKLNAICEEEKKSHKVIVMVEMGDLREGIWNKEEVDSVVLEIERELPWIELMGIGMNLGCYGTIRTTVKKMEELVEIAHHVEHLIGRKLEIVSGGASSATDLLLQGEIPKGINHLRIGGAWMIPFRVLSLDKKYSVGFHQDAFQLSAQIIELKVKPSIPWGEFSTDCFGNICEFKDLGLRKRAIIAVGRLDVGSPQKMSPVLKGIQVLGGSSDHTILDIEDCKEELEVGSILKFNLCYENLLYITASPNIEREVTKTVQ